jgi:hypothetical protein
MPLHIEWYIPYQVVDEKVWGQVTIEDVHQHTNCILTMLTEAQTHAPGTTIYQLFDDTEVESMPPVYLMISHALPVLRLQNRGPMLHIARKTAISNIMDITAHVMGFQRYKFETRQDAIRALELIMLKNNT